MKKIIYWFKAAVTRLTGANEAPSVETFEIDIMDELNRIDEETEISNFKWEL